MADGSVNPDLFGGGPVDQEQAAGLAAANLDPELVMRCRGLGEDLDRLHILISSFADRLVGTLDDLIDREDELGGPAVLTGADTTVTYATLLRARGLFRSWSGASALRARLYRVTNLLNEAAGFDQGMVDEGRIESDLTEERGR